MTTWRTWDGADAGHAEAREGTPALGPQGRGSAVGRGRLLRHRPPARRGRPDALAGRVARGLRRPAGRALVPAERGLRAPARGAGRGWGEGRCPGGLTGE